jgi:hypothetical protein
MRVFAEVHVIRALYHQFGLTERIARDRDGSSFTVIHPKCVQKTVPSPAQRVADMWAPVSAAKRITGGRRSRDAVAPRGRDSRQNGS